MTAQVERDGPDAFTIVSRTRYERAELCRGCGTELWTQVDEDGTRAGRFTIWCPQPIIMQPHYPGSVACPAPMPEPPDVPESPAWLDILPPRVVEGPPWTWGDAPGGA